MATASSGGKPAACRHGATALIVMLTLIAAIAPPALADSAAGRQAFDRGDIERALAEWQGAADHGDPEAQFGLGMVYEQGAGSVKQDYQRADYWFRKAAEQGNSEAQYRLALIWAAGNDTFAADLVEAYKWAIVTAASKGVWGSAAADLEDQLDRVLSPSERQAGKERAAAWKDTLDARNAPPAPAPAAPLLAAPSPPAPAAPGVAPEATPASRFVEVPTTGCPGWPFPTLPCTEQFPALPGQTRAGGSAALAQPAVSPPAAPGKKTALDELSEALKQIDCASLTVRPAEGSAIVSGIVPNADQKAKIVQTAARLFPNGRPEVAVEIVPPPLCRVIAELDGLRGAGLAAEGALTLRLTGGGARLRQGDPIELAVQAPAYPISLRIDYFSLDGRVVHLVPSATQSAPPQLAAGASRVFGGTGNGGDWVAGGAPFGTELISIVATPAPLALGANRPPTEPALDYLRDLKQSLSRTAPSAAKSALLGTLLVHTSAR